MTASRKLCVQSVRYLIPFATSENHDEHKHVTQPAGQLPAQHAVHVWRNIHIRQTLLMLQQSQASQRRVDEQSRQDVYLQRL
jgi:hypothetical protein